MISLCTFVKNEILALPNMISSIKDHVDEIVIVDTGSTDGTLEYARSITSRVYEVNFTDFGKIRTLTAHLAAGDWVLMLDADETLSNADQLKYIMKDVRGCPVPAGTRAVAFPRKRWLDLAMTQQTELEAYPDWQVRFFENQKSYVWKRELHEYFHGAAVYHMEQGPVINHFHDVFKTPEKLVTRQEQYEQLAKLAGVTVEGGHEI